MQSERFHVFRPSCSSIKLSIKPSHRCEKKLAPRKTFFPSRQNASLLSHRISSICCFPSGSVEKKNSPGEKVFSPVEQRGHDDLLRNNEDLPVSPGRHCRLRLTDRRKKVKRFARQLSIPAFISVDEFRYGSRWNRFESLGCWEINGWLKHVYICLKSRSPKWNIHCTVVSSRQFI